MQKTHYGNQQPQPHHNIHGWHIPIGIEVIETPAIEEEPGSVDYTAHEVLSPTLFQHDIEAAIEVAGFNPATYEADIEAAVRFGLPADWDGFNAYMLTDGMFKGYRDGARAVDGDINSALYDAYALVESNGYGAFSLVWNAWCAISGITEEDRNTVADTAQGFNLPSEFVAIIRP